MKFFKKVRNYLCYCGIEKDEFKEVKKEAYKSNFEVWRILNLVMLVAFAFLFFNSFISDLLKVNQIFYLILFVYSLIMSILFFILKKDSVIGQLFIYLSISMLFLFGCLITQNKPTTPATTFVVLLLITPMFMIDKPYFMIIELIAASTVFSIWMYFVKPIDVWTYDLINVVSYLAVGIVIHVIANSIRIKEFVLTRKINIQKDIDELTGIKNKGALTREINEFLADQNKSKGTLIVLDVDRFKSINDNFGHDVGDIVIKKVAEILQDIFTKGEIVGRFGGDEFIIFIKDKDGKEDASKFASIIVEKAKNTIDLPNKDQRVSVTMGIAIYSGEEKNYSELFKKADIALYNAKADKENRYYFYK